MTTNREAAVLFIDTLFGQALDDGLHMCVWTLADRASRFFTSVSDAADYACERALVTDVYAGAGLFREPPPAGRGVADAVDGIVALWADIDYLAADHKKKRLPPTIDDAITLAHSVHSAEPSLLVRSGNGVQAWWALSEPWMFESAADRERAKACSRRWVGTLKLIARGRGWELDSVGDLSRVMRVPGTFNRKSEPKAVTLDPLRGPVSRFTIEHLEERMAADELVGDSPVAVTVGHVTVTESVSEGALRLHTQLMQDPKYASSWNETRTDLGDTSPSSYDMSMAAILARTAATDQEICEIITWRRRERGHEIKRHVSYYQRTIARARAGLDRARAALDIVTSGPLPGARITSPDQKEAVLDAIRKATGVPIDHVVKQASENSTYAFILTDGKDVRVGSASDMLNQSHVRARVYDATGIVLPEFKKEAWNAVCSQLSAVTTVVSASSLERRSRVGEWLEEYLGHRNIGDETDDGISQAVKGGRPFVRGGEIHVNTSNFLTFIRTTLQEKVETAEFYDMLRHAGWREAARERAAKVRRRYWAAPRDDFMPEGDDSGPQCVSGPGGADRGV